MEDVRLANAQVHAELSMAKTGRTADLGTALGHSDQPKKSGAKGIAGGGDVSDVELAEGGGTAMSAPAADNYFKVVYLRWTEHTTSVKGKVTLSTCQDICDSKEKKCVLFSYNSKTKSCEWASNRELSYSPSWVFYAKEKKGSYVPVPGLKYESKKGRKVSQTKLKSCQKKCDAGGGCLGFGYSKDSRLCGLTFHGTKWSRTAGWDIYLKPTDGKPDAEEMANLQNLRMPELKTKAKSEAKRRFDKSASENHAKNKSRIAKEAAAKAKKKAAEKAKKAKIRAAKDLERKEKDRLKKAAAALKRRKEKEKKADQKCAAALKKEKDDDAKFSACTKSKHKLKMAAEESAARYKQAQGTAKSTAGNEKAAKADQAKGDGAKQKALLKHLKEAKASAHKLGVINKASTKLRTQSS